LDKLGDIAGYNGDGARLVHQSRHSQSRHRIQFRPRRPSRQIRAGWGDLLEGPGDKTQPYFWRYPWRSGEVLWCAFDHGSIAGDEGKTGIIDYFRLPKRGGIGIATNTATFRRRNGPPAARPPR
jgi:beta-galactosidase